MAVPRQSDVPTFQAPPQQRLEFIPRQVVVRVHEQALLEAADAAHPDLAGVVASYDHEGAGAVDIVGHGTHVSGIVAARVNNDVGIAGVAACRVAMWKVFPDEPYQGNFYVDGTRFLRALNAVATSGAKVLNLSLGGTQSSQAEQLLFDRLERAGRSAVAARGE